MGGKIAIRVYHFLFWDISNLCLLRFSKKWCLTRVRSFNNALLLNDPTRTHQHIWRVRGSPSNIVSNHSIDIFECNFQSINYSNSYSYSKFRLYQLSFLLLLHIFAFVIYMSLLFELHINRTVSPKEHPVLFLRGIPWDISLLLHHLQSLVYTKLETNVNSSPWSFV